MGGSEVGATERRRKHHWSYSKSLSYDTCPLKVYYPDSDSGESTQFKEKASGPINLHAIIGLAVHRGIASQVEEWAEGRSATFRGARKVAEEWIKAIWEDKDKRVIEAINGGNLPREQHNKFIGIAKRHLRMFFKAIWPEYRGHEYVLHERIRTFTSRGCRVHVKVDLCTRGPDGDLIITDWKTGNSPLLEFDSLQLKVYGLWARACVEEDTSKLKIRLAHTKTGDTSTHSVTPEQLIAVEEQIVDECREWDTKNGIEDFSFDPTLKKCLQCKYLTQCEPGQSTVL